MAAISPSPDSVPSNVPPQPSYPPPIQSTPAEEPNATTFDPPTPAPPSPPLDAPPPSTSGTPPPVTLPPVDPSPPPNPSAPPPSPPASPPPTPPSLPPSVSPPPPQTVPQPLPPPNPPTSAPPPPPSSTPPTSSQPPPSSSPPPTSSPTPPSSNPPSHSPPPTPSSEPPSSSLPPPSSRPPENSPPPPPSDPPKSSPSPQASRPPQSSPSPPSVDPPSTSPPSSTSTPPPSVTPLTPTPVSHFSPPSSHSPPPPGFPSSPSLPAHNSSFDAPQTAKASGKGGTDSGGAVAIGVVAGVLILGLIGLVAFWIFKRKKRTSGANGGHIIPASVGSSPRSDGKLLVKTENPGSFFQGGSGSDTPSGHGGFGHSRPWFTYQELLEATSGFSDENLLGEGGFGYVYKGILAGGRVVAVKQLKIGGQQGEREFKAEVEIISRIHHRHLVSLVGYCIWESRRLLVYDYVPNDTLHFHLHGGGLVLDWATRVKIASGAARGLAYLHEDCHPRIIHRDIKSSNILLDSNFEARVSDFGLAKLAMDADTHVSTRVMGTFGYLAPEYATSGKLSEKSDVYSFGVVLLELMTGRKPVDESQPLGDESLVEWARPRLTYALDSGEYECLVDPRLEKNYIESEMFRMIEAAAACVRHSAAKRPRMGQVVRALDGISDSGDLSNGLRVGESQLYDSAQQSAEIRWFRRVAFGSQGTSTDFLGSSSLNFGGDISRQHSRNSQNMGFSRQSGPNVYSSAQYGHGMSRDASRQHNSQSSQNMGFSRQSGPNVNSSAQNGDGLGRGALRQHNSQSSQNMGFSRQSELNVKFSAQQ